MDLAVVTPFPPRLTGISLYGLHLCRSMAQTGRLSRIVILTEHDEKRGRNARAAPYAWRSIGSGAEGTLRQACSSCAD